MFDIKESDVITKSDKLIFNLILEQQKTNKLLTELIELQKPKQTRTTKKK